MEILGSAASMEGGSAATGSSRYSFKSSSDMGTDAQKYEKVLLRGIMSPRKRSANWRTLSLERSSWAGIAGLAFILSAPLESCMQSGLDLFAMLYLPRPQNHRLQELAHDVPGRLIHQITLLVEALGRISDHHLGQIERLHVQEHE